MCDDVRKVSGLPQFFDVALRDGGDHPLASRSGHGWRRLRWEVRTWALELECTADGYAKEEEGVNGKGGFLSPYMGGRNYEPPPA